MKLKAFILSILTAIVLTASFNASANSCLSLPSGMERTEANVMIENEYKSSSPAQVVSQCVVMAIASSPATLWNGTCNCAENLKKLCSWSSSRGMRASGGASVAQCLVFLPFLR